jgi:hypothetical protein
VTRIEEQALDVANRRRRGFPRGVRSYLRPYRRELVRIVGIADAYTRNAAFSAFWSRHCAGWDRFDPRLDVPRSLRMGLGAPRTQYTPRTYGYGGAQ